MGSDRVKPCPDCGVWFEEKYPHDHRIIGTLSAEAAAAWWNRKVAAEREAREAADAAVSGE